MENRYEAVQHFMEWLIKDHKTKRWIATCSNEEDASRITFILNEFEKSKL